MSVNRGRRLGGCIRVSQVTGLHEKWKVPLDLPNPKGYRQPKRTSATPHVNRLVTVFPCRSHRGNHLENRTFHKKIWRKHRGLGKARYFGNPWVHHCSFRNSLACLDEEISSGCEEDVSSTGSGFSAWVKTVGRHIVYAKGANPAFREAPAQKHSPS